MNTLEKSKNWLNWTAIFQIVLIYHNKQTEMKNVHNVTTIVNDMLLFALIKVTQIGNTCLC